jgi:hypothetical protein
MITVPSSSCQALAAVVVSLTMRLASSPVPSLSLPAAHRRLQIEMINS